MICEKNGAQDWNRTSDTAIFSRMLYQLSYLGTASGLNHVGRCFNPAATAGAVTGN